MLCDPSAHVDWTVLDNEFLGQRESHALLLSAEFRTFKQGALHITDFCRRLETRASALTEFGDPVGDRSLVLTMLRGLNGKFRHMVSNLKMQCPFLTFDQARILLLLKEIDIKDVATDDPPPTLYAVPPPAPQRPPGGHAGGGSGAPPSGTPDGG
jgi:hypothetical protein